MIGARERAEKREMRPEPSCAAVNERARDRHDLLGCMHTMRSFT